MARAILEQGAKVRSLSLISPTGMGVRAPPSAPNGSRIDRFLSSRWVGRPCLAPDQQAEHPMVLGKSLCGATPEHMLRYALETANQPGAHYVPLKFLTFSLFTEQAITRLYSRLKLPCLVLYDQDPNIGFERMSELTDVHSNWVAKQLVPSLGLPHWELPAETIEALEDFWAPPSGAPEAQEISRSTVRAASRPDSVAIGTPGPGCTLPPERYKPFNRLRAPGRVKLDQIPCDAPP